MSITFNFIGKVDSPFKDKLGVPRSSGLCPSIKAKIHFDPQFVDQRSLEDLTGVEYIWVIFYFHMNKSPACNSTVRPPRLGGNKRVSVFATRAPYRPNPIGLSLVKLENLDLGRLELEVSAHDLLDGTPVLDIKPYIPYADFYELEKEHWFSNAPEKYDVSFDSSIQIDEKRKYEISEFLSYRPAVAYKKEGHVFKTHYSSLDIHWSYDREKIKVCKVKEVD